MQHSCFQKHYGSSNPSFTKFVPSLTPYLTPCRGNHKFFIDSVAVMTYTIKILSHDYHFFLFVVRPIRNLFTGANQI